jgi:NADH:ubiquinone oxidoreductase subunit E
MIKQLDEIIKRYHEANGNIISLLQDTQEAFGYIPRESIDYFSQKLNLAPSRFYGVATFYSQFRLKPVGKNRITACCGTACHVKGSEKIINSLRRELNLSEEKDTTDDGEFTLEQVNCVGACSIAPVIVMNKQVHGKAAADKIAKELKTIKGSPDAAK